MTVTISLDGRVALVTGSGAGIGRATAALLARAGAAVAVNDIDDARAKDSADAINHAGGRAVAIQADVKDPDQVEQLVARCVDELGSLDIAVNNVGMLAGLPPRAFVDLDADYIRPILDQNVMTSMLCGVAEARHGGGRSRRRHHQRELG